MWLNKVLAPKQFVLCNSKVRTCLPYFVWDVTQRENGKILGNPQGRGHMLKLMTLTTKNSLFRTVIFTYNIFLETQKLFTVYISSQMKSECTQAKQRELFI